MRRRLRTVLVSVLALLMLGSAPAAADPYPADPGACWANGDYQNAAGVTFQLVGEAFVPLSTTMRYWHVVDHSGRYLGSYVACCDSNHIMTREADFTRDHDNTGPAKLCEYADFSTVSETHNGRDEARYHYLGSRVSAAVYALDPWWGPIYRDYRYAYWSVFVSVVRYNPPSAFGVWVSEAARCPVGQNG